MGIKLQVTVTFVIIALALVWVNHFMDSRMAESTVQARTSPVAPKSQEVVAQKIAGKASPQVVAQTQPSPAKTATSQQKPAAFFPEGLVRVDTHAHGATAFYLDGGAGAQGPHPFYQDGLDRVDINTYGATAFYK